MATHLTYRARMLASRCPQTAPGGHTLPNTLTDKVALWRESQIQAVKREASGSQGWARETEAGIQGMGIELRRCPLLHCSQGCYGLSEVVRSGPDTVPAICGVCLVVSNSLRPHKLQHARLPCPSPSPGTCSNSCPLSR